MDSYIEYLVAFSVNDPAGKGIAEALIDIAHCNKIDYIPIIDLKAEALYLCKDLKSIIVGFNEDVLFFDFLENVKDVKYFIILSRHTSESGMPSLTTHVPGNPWGKNVAGGKPWEMPPANPILMWYFLKELNIQCDRHNMVEFKRSYEVTHHGPTSITRPITFVEIGSSEREWRMVNAHRAVAFTVVEGIKKMLTNIYSSEPCIVSIGFGGTHYAPLFTRRAIEYNECYGHIIPNYVIKELGLEDIRSIAIKAINATPKVKRVVIEKMKSEVRKVIASIAKEQGLDVISY
uniref:D-aminoacyl-tRNA deacylase n=1 Tax=Ignisphaera aggregans TaxID=334771 RepID=A0A7C5UUE4_9CREN